MRNSKLVIVLFFVFSFHACKVDKENLSVNNISINDIHEGKGCYNSTIFKLTTQNDSLESYLVIQANFVSNSQDKYYIVDSVVKIFIETYKKNNPYQLKYCNDILLVNSQKPQVANLYGWKLFVKKKDTGIDSLMFDFELRFENPRIRKYFFSSKNAINNPG